MDTREKDRERPAPLGLARRVRRSIVQGLIVMSIAAGVSVVGGLLAYILTDRAYSRILNDITTVQDHVGNLNNAVIAEVLNARSYVITGDEAAVTRRTLAHEEFEHEFVALQVALAGTDPLVALGRIGRLHAKYDAIADSLIDLRKSGQADAVVQLFDERSDPIVVEILDARRELEEGIQESLVGANHVYSRRSGQLITLVAVSFLFGTVTSSWLMTRLPAPSLESLDYLERAMRETVEFGIGHQIRLPESVSSPKGSIFSAYNSLVDRLERSEALQFEFLGSVSHELRLPLASIMGYAEMVGNRALRLPESDLALYGQTILKQAQHMSELIENFLRASKVGENRLEVFLAPVRLGPIVAEVVEEMRLASGRKIVLRDRLSPMPVVGDGLRLRELMLNLIDNAIKFSSPETPVHVTLQPAASAGWAEIQVEDQGIGIAEAEMPMLFRRFGRIKNEHTRGIPGSGLGLYIVNYVVHRHGGRIDVRSRPGHGTSFSVFLPLERGPA